MPNCAEIVACCCGVVTTSSKRRSVLFRTLTTFALMNGIAPERVCCRSPSARRIPCAAWAMVGLFLMARSTACSSVTDSIAGAGVCASAGVDTRSTANKADLNMRASCNSHLGMPDFARDDSADKHVEHWNEENRQEGRREHAACHSRTYRVSGAGPGACSIRERKHPQDEGERGHQDGPEPDPRRFDGRL